MDEALSNAQAVAAAQHDAADAESPKVLLTAVLDEAAATLRRVAVIQVRGGQAISAATRRQVGEN